MVKKKQRKHNRYKIEIKKMDSVIQTLGVPVDRTRFRVLEVARRELRRIPTATHAEVRGLDGKQVIIYTVDGWWSSQLKALKINCSPKSK